MTLVSCAGAPQGVHSVMELHVSVCGAETESEGVMRRATVALALLGLLLAACAGDDRGEPFDFESDDLCTWIPAEDVGEFVEEAYGWEVIAVDLVTPPSSDAWECQWKLTGSDGRPGEVAAEQVDWETFGGLPYQIHEAMTGEVVDFPDLDQSWVPIGATVSGHPSMGSGVLVHNGGFGQFAFGVPPQDQYLQVSVAVPDDEDWEVTEPRFLAVANSMIEALGWLQD